MVFAVLKRLVEKSPLRVVIACLFLALNHHKERTQEKGKGEEKRAEDGGEDGGEGERESEGGGVGGEGEEGMGADASAVLSFALEQSSSYPPLQRWIKIQCFVHHVRRALSSPSPSPSPSPPRPPAPRGQGILGPAESLAESKNRSHQNQVYEEREEGRRAFLMRARVRLRRYQGMMVTCASLFEGRHYGAVYGAMRGCSVAAAACLYAQTASLDRLHCLLSLHPALVLPSLVEILNNFPEAMDPTLQRALIARLGWRWEETATPRAGGRMASKNSGAAAREGKEEGKEGGEGEGEGEGEEG